MFRHRYCCMLYFAGTSLQMWCTGYELCRALVHCTCIFKHSPHLLLSLPTTLVCVLLALSSLHTSSIYIASCWFVHCLCSFSSCMAAEGCSITPCHEVQHIVCCPGRKISIGMDKSLHVQNSRVFMVHMPSS